MTGRHKMVPSYDAITACLNYKGDRESGVDAQFIPLNDMWGFKYYKKEARAIALYMRQKWAARHFLGPMLGDLTSFDYRGTRFWGFVTQRLLVPKNESDCPVYAKFKAVVGDWLMRDNHPLIQQLKNIGLGVGYDYNSHLDMHFKNCGFTEDDSLIPIDFGWGDEWNFDLTRSDISDILRKHNLTQQEFIRA